MTNTTRTEQCVSLGLGQFLDRIAVQEQDRKLEPFFSFSPTAGSAAHACCERALCSILRVGAVYDAPQNENCSPKTKSSKHTRACVCPPPASCEYIANKYLAHACVLRQTCTDAPSYGAWRCGHLGEPNRSARFARSLRCACQVSLRRSIHQSSDDLLQSCDGASLGFQA